MTLERIAIAGDWHGNGRWAERVIERVANRGVRHLFQIGDFGLWPGIGGVKYLDVVNSMARKTGVTVYALRGNHDWNWWEELLGSDFSVRDNITGGVYVRSHIVLLPRTGSFFLGFPEEHRREIFVAGGAVSIDKSYRVVGESWWVEEQLTDAEVEAIPERRFDILLTHDCSNKTPFRDRLKPDLDSVAHRQRIDRVLAKTSPKVHFHGHMHTWYDWMNPVGPRDWTQTYGLEMDGDQRATGILDLKTLEFNLL